MNVVEVNKDSFDEEVIQSEKKVLVDFNASWCGPCKMLKPIIEEYALDNDNVKVVSVNIDDEDELAEKYNVLSIPCLILFDKGKEIKRHVGLLSRDDINSFIDE